MTTLTIISIINLIIFYKINNIVKFLNIYDLPNQKRKIHKEKIPKIGGVIILFNILIIYFLEIFSFELDYSAKINLNILLFGSLLIFLVGLIDDLKDLNPNLKLFLFSVIIISFLFFEKNLILSELRFSFFEKNIDLGIFSLLFTAFCILLFINAINMFDGINLQVISYSSFLFLLNCFYLENLYLFAIFFPSIIILILLNYQNKLFLGDNGSLLIGFLISCFFIFNYNNDKIENSDTIFIFMMLPGLELLRLAITRILKKRNPFSADDMHIHHLLLKKFKYNSVIMINFMSILIPIFLIFFTTLSNLFIILMYLIVYLGSIYWLSKY